MLSAQTLDMLPCRPEADECAAVPAEIRFGVFRLMTCERRLERAGVAVALGGRAMDLLTALACRAGEVVSKADLSQAAWPGMVVEETSLRFHIASLRRALGENGSREGMLKTVAGRGYCLTVARWEPAPDNADEEPQLKLIPPPSRPRRLIGMEQTVRDAAESLMSGRFLTLVGAPGIGKTTVALDLCHRLGTAFPGGIAFVDLGAVCEAGQVPQAVAAALGRSPVMRNDPEDLVAMLAGREMLLVLDGCEHLIDTVADLAGMLARHLPGIAILATSRESLRVEGEHVCRISPLTCPPRGMEAGARTMLAFPAVDFFIDRVKAGRVGYELADDDAKAIAEICRNLDGIPLALQLAAAQVANCGLAQTLALMKSPMRLFWQGWRTAPPRHQTLKATLDWSYHLLSDEEQRVFRRLGVFVGGFSLALAQGVAMDDDLSRDRVTQILADLVARSLLVVEDADDEPHYRLHDMTRAYALVRLEGCGEAEATLRQQACSMLMA